MPLPRRSGSWTSVSTQRQTCVPVSGSWLQVRFVRGCFPRGAQPPFSTVGGATAGIGRELRNKNKHCETRSYVLYCETCWAFLHVLGYAGGTPCASLFQAWGSGCRPRVLSHLQVSRTSGQVSELVFRGVSVLTHDYGALSTHRAARCFFFFRARIAKDIQEACLDTRSVSRFEDAYQVKLPAGTANVPGPRCFRAKEGACKWPGGTSAGNFLEDVYF